MAAVSLWGALIRMLPTTTLMPTPILGRVRGAYIQDARSGPSTASWLGTTTRHTRSMMARAPSQVAPTLRRPIIGRLPRSTMGRAPRGANWRTRRRTQAERRQPWSRMRGHGRDVVLRRAAAIRPRSTMTLAPLPTTRVYASTLSSAVWTHLPSTTWRRRRVSARPPDVSTQSSAAQSSKAPSTLTPAPTTCTAADSPRLDAWTRAPGALLPTPTYTTRTRASTKSSAA